MLHGLGDCTPELNCGCIGAGDGRRPPSQAVIEAVEQAVEAHGAFGHGRFRCRCGWQADPRGLDAWREHVRAEVARAAETAALKVAAERMDDLSRGTPLAAAITAKAAAKRLTQWADELTDTDRERVQG